MSEHDQIENGQTGSESEGSAAPEYSRREAMMAVRKYALGTSVVALTASKAVTAAASSS